MHITTCKREEIGEEKNYCKWHSLYKMYWHTHSNRVFLVWASLTLPSFATKESQIYYLKMDDSILESHSTA